MTVYFFDPILRENGPLVSFPGCSEVVHTNRAVVATIQGVDYRLAFVEANRHLVIYTIDPECYAAIFKCPQPDRKWSFYGMRVTP